MRQTLQRAWLQRGPLAWLLWPVSLVFRLLSALRGALYRLGVLRTQRLPVPVIVVGNVVAGGAGKTPVVIAVLRHLQSLGMAAGAVSRGYGRTSQGSLEVTAQHAATDTGDEPLLIVRATGAPMAVGESRVDAARLLLDRHPQLQILVSDDGLQHQAMARDIEICVFDDRGAGNGFLLPAGPLREPWPRAVDFVLHTGEADRDWGNAPSFRLKRELASHAVDASGRRVALADLAGQPVTALAGIARPEAFFDMLAQCGVQASQRIALDDHFDFSGWQVPGGTVLCTEKDAVKLWPHHPGVLAVPLEVSLPDAFWKAFDARLSSLHGHQTP